jgi:hypothetical protein
MSSQMKYTPDPYTNRQNDIITNNTPYNGRVNLEEPENPDARFQMFERIEIKNKATEYRDPLKGDIEDTLFSRAYFSAANIQIVQNGLKAGVYNRSEDRELIIPNQNIDILKTIMRHMFLQHADFKPDNITQQIERLNQIVLDYTVPKVFSEAIGYLKYLEDQSRLVVPIALPQQTDRVYKQLELKPFM